MNTNKDKLRHSDALYKLNDNNNVYIEELDDLEIVDIFDIQQRQLNFSTVSVVDDKNVNDPLENIENIDTSPCLPLKKPRVEENYESNNCSSSAVVKNTFVFKSKQVFSLTLRSTVYISNLLSH